MDKKHHKHPMTRQQEETKTCDDCQDKKAKNKNADGELVLRFLVYVPIVYAGLYMLLANEYGDGIIYFDCSMLMFILADLSYIRNLYKKRK